MKGFTLYKGLEYTEDEMTIKARENLEIMRARRSVRDFSTRPVPFEIIRNIILTAGSAPSGANKQPWHFALIKDPSVKKTIRIEAEKEEELNYSKRMPERWLKDLEPLGTDQNKPFLEDAPWLIVIFKKSYDLVSGEKVNNYYVNESVGIAAGFLINAIHRCGLVTLTHTPSPMNFLSKILNRPENEKAFLLLPVGFPAEKAQVPDIKKKNFEEIVTIF